MNFCPQFIIILAMATINEINWFPGHMRKAINRIQEKLKQCDGVIEIGDARAPFSSFPDYLDHLTEGKVKVFVFSKIDLADETILKKQMERMQDQGIKPFCYDLREKKSGKDLLNYLSSVRTSQDARYQKLGFPLPIKRFIVLGIPNVGKSTFINSLAGKKKAAVENKPGKTRAEQLIHVSDKVYIFDAPGILEPNYEDKTVIAKLALLGSVKQDILPLIALSDFLLDFLRNHYTEQFLSRFPVDLSKSDEEVFTEMATIRNLLLPGGIPDSERARTLLLYEFRNGSLGRISLDD